MFTLAEAKGLLPRHPNCLCSFIPANVGESEAKQLRTRSRIKAAIDRSIGAERPAKTKRTLAEQKRRTTWAGAVRKIANRRPKSILTENIFCPTGPGGGVDPHCGKGGLWITDESFGKAWRFVVDFEVEGKRYAFEAYKFRDSESEGYDKNQWDVSFGAVSGGGGITSTMPTRSEVSAVKVLSGVNEAFDVFMRRKNPDRVMFTATLGEPSKVKFYDRASRKLALRYGYEVETRKRFAFMEYELKKSK